MKRRVVLGAVGLMVLLCGLVPGASAAGPGQQTGDVELVEHIEDLALRVHLHNTRSGDLMVWAGGTLGTQTALKPNWPIGTPLKDWDLPGLGEGQSRLSLADLKRPTLLNIWGSWCPPCVDEFPLLTQVALAPDDHAYDVIFVNAFDYPERALDFLRRQPEGLRVVSDDVENVLPGMIGSTALPTSILIDADHNVIAIQVGNYTSVQAALFEILARDPGPYTGSFDPSDRAEPDHFVEILPVDAAEALPGGYGETEKGTITGEDFQQVYAFVGHAGDVVSVRMDAERAPSRVYELEPYVVLLTPDGEYLAESRDFLYEPYAQVQQVTLPEDGTYFVVATRYMGAEGVSAGEYTLTITGQEP